jgi:hypothetical protein
MEKKIEKTKRDFTTIYMPKTLHNELTQIILENSIKTGKKVHIWEFIAEKIKQK